jgi:hypothetical protein
LSVALLVTVICLVACQASQANESYLNANTCTVPCWQEITPGSTTKQKALDIIKSSNLIENQSIEERSLDSSYSTYNFWLTDGARAQVAVKNQIVLFIAIWPHNPPGLGEIFDFWGEPNFVSVKETPTNFVCYTASLFYLEKGIWVDATICDTSATEYEVVRRQAKIYSGMEVDHIRFFKPQTDLHSLLAESGMSSTLFEKVITYASPWAGPGFYQLAP